MAFRVMSLVLQLHLVMISKYSKFGVATFKTFLVMGEINVFAQQRQQQLIAQLFLFDDLKMCNFLMKS